MGAKTHRCINCGIRMINQFTAVSALEPASRELLSQWISNVVVSDAHELCYECTALAAAGAPAPRVLGHEAVCLSCGRSVLRRRIRVRLSTQPPEVVEKLMEFAGEFRGSHMDCVCAACVRRGKRAAAPPAPPRAPRRNSPEPETVEMAETEGTEAKKGKKSRELQLSVTLGKYSRLRATSRRCIVEDCVPATVPLDLHPVPLAMRQIIFIYHQVYIPNTTRICATHLTQHDGTKLRSQTVQTFTADHIEDMMFLAKSIDPIDFKDIEGMDQHLRKHWMGVSWEEFRDMLTRSELSGDEGQMALTIYLVGKHSKEGPEVLASIFQIPRSKVEEKLKIAEGCLKRKGEASDGK